MDVVFERKRLLHDKVNNMCLTKNVSIESACRRCKMSKSSYYRTKKKLMASPTLYQAIGGNDSGNDSGTNAYSNANIDAAEKIKNYFTRSRSEK